MLCWVGDALSVGPGRARMELQAVLTAEETVLEVQGADGEGEVEGGG